MIAHGRIAAVGCFAVFRRIAVVAFNPGDTAEQPTAAI
jgi:hypothetical protein